jgi:hypothetical protein
MKSRINEDDENLYCVWCKNKINLGEKFIIAPEELYDDTVVLKSYHPECLPEMEDDE